MEKVKAFIRKSRKAIIGFAAVSLVAYLASKNVSLDSGLGDAAKAIIDSFTDATVGSVLNSLFVGLLGGSVVYGVSNSAK